MKKYKIHYKIVKGSNKVVGWLIVDEDSAVLAESKFMKKIPNATITAVRLLA